MTPWHGVALKTEGRFVLVKRAEAEALGARLMSEDNSASYYETPLKSLRPPYDE
jgi:pyoverdine/dityrosine biosynthesis protein Dit1